MARKMTRMLPVAVAVMGLFPMWTLAAQLGKIEILSGADEPFRATIQVDGVLPSEKSSLQVSLADKAAFTAARLAYDPQLNLLKFDIVETTDPGKAAVLITSAEPLNAGFIDTLVELSWSGGQVAREYTLTVPVRPIEAPIKPVLPLQDSVAKAPAVVEQPKPQAAKPAPKLEVAKDEPKPKSKPELKPTNKPTTKSGELVVTAGQTLSEIALDLVGDGVTLNQAMAAIFEANRGAFYGDSVHNLRKGATLQIPNQTALRARDRNEALLILAKNDDRNVYSDYARRLGLLTTVAQQENLSAESSNTGSGQIAQKAPASAVAEKQVDRLKVGPGGEAGQAEAIARADAMAEESLAKDKALNEANERIALLEQNISDLQKLMQMQDEVKGGSEQVGAYGAKQPGHDGSEHAAKESHKGPSVPGVVADTPAGQEPAPADKPADENVSKEEPSHSEQKPDSHGEVAKSDAPEDHKADVPAEEPPVPAGATGSGLTAWLTSPWLLGGLGAVGLGVLGLLLWRLRSRSQPSDDDFDLEDEEPSNSSESFDEALAWASSSSASAASKVDEAKPKSISEVESEDFDLDEVLADPEPKETYTPTPEPELDPEPEPGPEPEMEDELSDEVERTTAAQLAPESIEARKQSTSLNSDVELDFPSDEPAPQDSSIMDDLEDMEKGVESAQKEISDIKKDSGKADEAFDDLIDAGKDEPDDSEDASEPTELDAEKAEADFEKAVGDLDLDLPNSEIDEATWQEVATKLDLAGAYVEIGDADGARDLLQEIISKGDPDQVRKAKELLDSLG